MRYYLGLGGSKHDFATCLVADGQVVAAVEDERLARKKRGYGIPMGHTLASVSYCLDMAGVRLRDIDAILTNDLLEPWCYESLGKGVHVVGHHLTHAASTFYPSGFVSSAVLVADHSGGRWREPDGALVAEVVSFYQGSGDDLTLLDRVACGDSDRTAERCPAFAADLRGSLGTDLLKRPVDSLGRFYARLARIAGCTSVLGDGQVHTESGKLMGLSAHGSADFVRALRACYTLTDHGRVRFHADRSGRGFEQLARDYLAAGVEAADGEPAFRRRANLAFAAQRCLEEMILHSAQYARGLTGETFLAAAGGIFLNGLANEAILRRGTFEHAFIQPASHDAGTALGAAILGAVRDGQWRRPEKPFSALLGRAYSENEVVGAMADATIPHRKVQDPEVVTARAIADGCVVARFYGRGEFGPRALGHRSILADPRRESVRRVLDERIKYREPYRPYAPVVRVENTARYFETSGPSPYMLLIGIATAEGAKAVPAVVHRDGTVRVQEVDAETDPELHRLLGCFEQIAGVPVLLNTSMNVQGEPIVETPEDAARFLFTCNVDALVIEGYVCARSDALLARFLDRYAHEDVIHAK